MQEISNFKCPYISKDQIWQEAEKFMQKNLGLNFGLK